MNTIMLSQNMPVFDVQNFQHVDTLHVHWELTQVCNARCTYCNQWDDHSNTIYVKERILQMAYVVMSTHRPYYAFTFTGGEPTMHPFLPEILGYLYSTRIPLAVNIETNGLRDLDYYKQLIDTARDYTLQFTISAHLEKIELKELCLLVAMIAENKQHVHVRLVYDSEQRESARVFHHALIQLRAVVPFAMSVWPLMQQNHSTELDARYTDDDFAWMAQADKEFANAAAVSPHELPASLSFASTASEPLPVFDIQQVVMLEDGDDVEFQPAPLSTPAPGTRYCCAGMNFLYIHADGKYQGAFCRKCRAHDPLWKKDHHGLDDLPRVLACTASQCSSPLNGVLPKFATQAEAENCLKGYAERALTARWEAAPVPNPVHPEPTVEDVVRLRLKRMQPLRRTVERIDPETTAIITFVGVIEEAIAHYQQMGLPKLPDFALVDWDGSVRPELDALAAQHHVVIVPTTLREQLNKQQFCLYARPLKNYWEKDGFHRLVRSCTKQGLVSGLLLDAKTTSQFWKRAANPAYIRNRFDDICTVYAALKDDESRDIFLRTMKCIGTGDAGYLRELDYSQYNHPLVMADMGDVVFEGGLENGGTTLSFSRQVGDTGRVYGFEPLSKAVIDSRFRTKSCSNVIIEPVGLWSGPCTFYIEDNAGGSRMVAKPTERSEECRSIALDDYIAEHREICTMLKLDIEGAEMECLKGAARIIEYHHPKLQISLYHCPEHYLDIPLLLLKKYPWYTLYMGHHGPWYSETCLYALPPALPKRYAPLLSRPADGQPRVSVIVPTHNNEDTLKRCLDSALIQGIAHLELIVIDDASTDKTPEIIAEYARRYPKIVRTMRFSENKGPGPARNAGMDMASGEYMAFIDSDDMLAENFLKRGLEVMQAEQADIVAFDTVVNNEGKETLWGVEPGAWAGADSLRQLLLKKTGGYGTYCRLYRTAMLRAHQVEYGTTAVHQDMFFSVQAFYYSGKTVVVPEVGYYRYTRSDSNAGANHGEKKVIAFISLIGFLTRFFEAHGLSQEDEMYRHCIRVLYGWDRASVFTAIREADTQGRLQELLTEERLLELGSSKEALCLILADYALLHCHRKGLNPRVAPKDLDWEAAAAAPRPPKTNTAYGNADTSTGPSPVLSVIVPNYNKEKYLKKCLDSILTQSMQDFEVIIIDDASTDSSYEMLQDYADAYPCIRLYRMDYNNMQGVCRNIGIEKARGKYITFVDSDDWLVPDFFALAVSKMHEEQADILAFAAQNVLPDGTVQAPRPTKPLRAGGVTACTGYWSDVMPWGPWGKIFSTDFLLNNTEVRFSEGVYHQDVYFMSCATRASNLTVTSNIIVYNVVLSEKSSIRRSTQRYVHIHSVSELLVLRQSISNLIPLKNNAGMWDLQQNMLPAIAAFWAATGKTAIGCKDFSTLSCCIVFISSLLAGYAKCLAAGAIQDGILIARPLRLCKDFVHTSIPDPLVSVIIPTYNQEECIERCLNSVLSQSLRSLEVIVINDASTDKTLDLCLAYAEKDPRVRVYSNEKNMGQGYSRNWALELSRGEYVTYVDSDDYIFPNFLLHGVSLLEYSPELDIVQFGHKEVNVNREVVEFGFSKNMIHTGLEVLTMYCFGKCYSNGPVSKLYRRRLIDDNKILFPQCMFEDSVFLINVYWKACYILFVDEYAYMIVKTPHQASAMNPIKYTPRHVQGHFSLCAEITSFFKNCIDVDPDMVLASERIKKRFENFAKKPLLNYIASFHGSSISPLTDEDLANLKLSPDFMKIILNDYAALYAKHTNYTPALSSEDLDPLYTHRELADFLVPVPFHNETVDPIILSVIIPAYNVAPYLARCLDSVLDQKVEGVEIILVEDCSPNDETLAICEEYARNNDCIRLFKTPWNSGQGTVRNLAMKQARGTYLTFVDSDDWLAENFLRRGVEAMNNNPECELIDFSWCAWDDIKNEQMYVKLMPDNMYVDALQAVKLYVEGTFSSYGAWSKIINRQFIVENSIQFSTCYYEDEQFLITLYSKIRSMMFSSIMSYYYVRNTQTPSTMRPACRGKKYFESTLANLSFVHNFFAFHKEYGESSPEYKRRIASYCWGHHRDNLLHYIHACNALNLPSPLTDEVLDTLTISKEFMCNLIMDYAVLSQKVLPLTKEKK